MTNMSKWIPSPLLILSFLFLLNIFVITSCVAYQTKDRECIENRACILQIVQSENITGICGTHLEPLKFPWTPINLNEDSSPFLSFTSQTQNHTLLAVTPSMEEDKIPETPELSCIFEFQDSPPDQISLKKAFRLGAEYLESKLDPTVTTLAKLPPLKESQN